MRDLDDNTRENQEHVSNVLNSKLKNDITVYVELCKTLGIEDEHIDCDSMIWHEIELFLVDKLLEMREGSIDYIERSKED